MLGEEACDVVRVPVHPKCAHSGVEVRSGQNILDHSVVLTWIGGEQQMK